MMGTEKIKAEVAKFPETFGLRAFPGKRFNINESACYESGEDVYLYVFTEDGKSFCKGTPSELRREIV